MKVKAIFPIFLFLLAGTVAKGQFFTQGSDPASVRWMHLDTPNYSIIYPKGLDSLARIYARNMEAVRLAESHSIGFVPNQNHSGRMPVILHSYSTASNGVVTWSPRRTEFVTTPEWLSPEATPWEKQLAVHESRHIAQMQFTQAKPFFWLRCLTGELMAGVLPAIYAGPAFLEGDAVVAETALTGTGRGRTADFLEYYRVCWDKGLNRDYWQWRWGSQRRYTPDHYTIGYIMMGGMRSVYDCPDFTKRYFERIREHGGFAFWNFQKTIRETSGKTLRKSFKEISARMNEEWREEADARAPFMPSEQVSGTPRSFLEYSNIDFDGGTFLAVREGLQTSPELVTIENGEENKIADFNRNASFIRSRYGVLYWSEQKPDLRWELRSFSDIRCCGKNGRIRTLTHGERYFNPAPSPSGKTLSVTEYPVEGGSNLVLIDAVTGRKLRSFPAPDGYQIVESAWIGEDIYVSAISEEGFGICRLDDFSPVLAPRRFKIKNLSQKKGELVFISDRNGVDELYSINPENGAAKQLSNTRYGIGDYCFVSDTLFYNVLRPEGRIICKTGISDLPEKEVNFSEGYIWKMAEKLSAGEKIPVTDTFTVSGKPKKYSKLAHLIRFHSWLPLYFNYDNVSSLSFDELYMTAGLGATGYFQNDLGTAYGLVAYNAQCNSGEWRHTGHLKFSYAGLYPVLEASLDFNTRNNREYSLKEEGGKKMSVTGADAPLVSFSLDMYIPFCLNSGGWLRGIVPQVNFGISNDFYSNSGKNTPITTLDASLRGYIMLRTPGSCIYPRWGIGAQLGFSTRPALDDLICSTAYGHIYGYVPGIMRTHGIRLSATAALQASNAPFCEEATSTLPRGFSPGMADVLSTYPFRTKLSIDYALPFAPVDWSALCPVAYIRNFELTLHSDFSFADSSRKSGNLFSAGADLTVRLANLLWAPYDTRIGVSFDYNGGSLFQTYSEQFNPGRTSVRLLFSIDI